MVTFILPALHHKVEVTRNCGKLKVFRVLNKATLERLELDSGYDQSDIIFARFCKKNNAW